jgi:hypothetical protein
MKGDATQRNMSDGASEGKLKETKNWLKQSILGIPLVFDTSSSAAISSVEDTSSDYQLTPRTTIADHKSMPNS